MRGWAPPTEIGKPPPAGTSEGTDEGLHEEHNTMLKWNGTPRPFTGVTPIRSVRRPLAFTRREIAGAIAFALLMGIVGWAGTVALLSLGR